MRDCCAGLETVPDGEASEAFANPGANSMATGCRCTARTALRLTSDGFYGGAGRTTSPGPKTPALHSVPFPCSPRPNAITWAEVLGPHKASAREGKNSPLLNGAPPVLTSNNVSRCDVEHSANRGGPTVGVWMVCAGPNRSLTWDRTASGCLRYTVNCGYDYLREADLGMGGGGKLQKALPSRCARQPVERSFIWHVAAKAPVRLTPFDTEPPPS